MTLYELAEAKANEVEAELKRLNRWSNESLPPEKFINMGAFGSNTMAFEQWLQFVLVPRIKEIVSEQGDFPDSSMVSTYAVREFDGDPEAANLQDLLYELDQLINTKNEVAKKEEKPFRNPVPLQETVSLIDTEIPPVLYTLANLLHHYSGDDLESQLQTFDTFLTILSPVVRPAVHDMLQQAACKIADPISRQRIEKAALSILNGGNAAVVYNHEKAMKKYRDEQRKSFPDE